MSGALGRNAGPYVVAHVAVSVDGATTGFPAEVGRFYELAGTWNEDVTLAGADTILAQQQAVAEAAHPGPAKDGPLLAVVDGKGRVTQWDELRDLGHWSDVLAIYSQTTPPRPAHRAVRELVVGAHRVDLAGALQALGQQDGIAVVRVDSGGGLIGALLNAQLLDEVSLLVHPDLAGPQADRRWYGTGPAPACALELIAAETLDQGLVWLRYRVPAM